ncbi:MAG: Hsp20/alpha crystallin family protein [Phycisphaerae bacterium]
MTTELKSNTCESTAVQARQQNVQRCYTPKVDILESDSDVNVLVEMPGVAAGDVDLTFEDGILTVTGKVAPRQDKGTRYLHREYGVGDFYRRFEVSELIQADAITAKIEHGVLSVTLPKAEAARPRKIEVSAG